MIISDQWLIPLIIGFLIAFTLNSDRVIKRLLAISNKLADAYYNKKKEKLKKTYENLNDDITLLILSNEIYKINFVKKPQLMLIIYLVIYSTIIISVAFILSILNYNVIVYILSFPVVSLLTLLAIKIKQKLKSRGGNQQQHVV